ncbi:hypothetical protein KQX54_004897 [Cotesia glomerata]|uniref:Uncharacterized protein n=1 Tax=Cotesia glomerata TaxID=32391 RepID=A0AAV7ICZ0_COTGL|nr:hypothetical protein KQX54_004897 [Cotesia glomerata]
MMDTSEVIKNDVPRSRVLDCEKIVELTCIIKWFRESGLAQDEKITRIPMCESEEKRSLLMGLPGIIGPFDIINGALISADGGPRIDESELYCTENNNKTTREGGREIT